MHACVYISMCTDECVCLCVCVYMCVCMCVLFSYICVFCECVWMSDNFEACMWEFQLIQKHPGDYGIDSKVSHITPG